MAQPQRNQNPSISQGNMAFSNSYQARSPGQLEEQTVHIQSLDPVPEHCYTRDDREISFNRAMATVVPEDANNTTLIFHVSEWVDIVGGTDGERLTSLEGLKGSVVVLKRVEEVVTSDDHNPTRWAIFPHSERSSIHM